MNDCNNSDNEEETVNIVVILYNVHICCVIGHCIPIQCCSFSVILRLILLRVFIMGEKQNGQEWNLSIFNFQPPNFSLTLFSFSNCHYYHFSHPTKVPKNLQWKRKVPNWLIKKVPVVKTTMIHATTKSSYYYFKNISDCNILILISNINPPMHEKNDVYYSMRENTTKNTSMIFLL